MLISVQRRHAMQRISFCSQELMQARARERERERKKEKDGIMIEWRAY